MELSVTIKEILSLLENKLKLLEDDIEKRKVIVKNNLLNLKEYIAKVEASVREVQCVNFQVLAQDFIHYKESSATRSKWLFFKEDYIKKETYLDGTRLTHYIQDTFKLSVEIHSCCSRAGVLSYLNDFEELGNFHFKGETYNVLYNKDSIYRRKEELSYDAIDTAYARDAILYELNSSSLCIFPFEEELLHLQKVFGESKVITLNEKQIKLIGE